MPDLFQDLCHLRQLVSSSGHLARPPNVASLFYCSHHKGNASTRGAHILKSLIFLEMAAYTCRCQVSLPLAFAPFGVGISAPSALDPFGVETAPFGVETKIPMPKGAGVGIGVGISHRR